MENEQLKKEHSDKLIGKMLGKYKLVEKIGYGAMARVYKGHHELLDRYVAVKILHPQLAADKEFVAQFISEARNLANLKHANIVQVHDIDIEGDLPYLVMEYIDGVTLKDALVDLRDKPKKRFSIKKSIRIIQYIGGALSYAHKQNVVHRDVKPSNVLIENTGRVVLADFGLAKLKTGVSTTLSGTIKGTPAYMSPEQGLGNSGDMRSDQYALGVVFYELATGQLPFTADNAFSVAMKHINNPVPPPKTVADGIPDEVERVILKALEKEPEDRYQTIELLLEDINLISEANNKKIPTARLSNTEELPPGAMAPIISTNAQVSIHIIDTGQIMYLSRGKKYTIGRADEKRIPDIDLGPFKAYEWGISRLHAELEVGDEVTVTDLNSSNGTRIRGKKIPADTPVRVNHGDTIKFGKLKIQILIYR